MTNRAAKDSPMTFPDSKQPRLSRVELHALLDAEKRSRKEPSIHADLVAEIRKHAARCNMGEEPDDGVGWVGALAKFRNAIASGALDTILGVREPTIEDVQREAVRVFGPTLGDIDVLDERHTWPGVEVHLTGWFREALRAPTVKSAYAALRALPDYEEPT